MNKLSKKLNLKLDSQNFNSNNSDIFELNIYKKFRDTKDVRFFDISAINSNFRN